MSSDVKYRKIDNTEAIAITKGETVCIVEPKMFGCDDFKAMYDRSAHTVTNDCLTLYDHRKMREYRVYFSSRMHGIWFYNYKIINNIMYFYSYCIPMPELATYVLVDVGERSTIEVDRKIYEFWPKDGVMNYRFKTLRLHSNADDRINNLFIAEKFKRTVADYLV